MSYSWQGLSPPVAFKMHVQNAMAWDGSAASQKCSGFGMGFERLAWDGERGPSQGIATEDSSQA